MSYSAGSCREYVKPRSCDGVSGNALASSSSNDGAC